MKILIGLENGNEGRSVAWVLEHFSCFATGQDGQTAIVSLANAIPEYIAWMAKHTAKPWFSPDEIEIHLEEVVEDWRIDSFFNPVSEGGRLIKAWFKHDWKPVTQSDAEHILQLLSWNRQDLLELISSLDPQDLDKSFEPGEWTIRQIIGHIGRSEWWLADRLGRTHGEELLPEDPFERLIQERGNLVNIIPDLVDTIQVAGKDGEIWSPRKVLRRACWHERDHLAQIHRYLAM
jgi:hypothetical protein